MSEEPITRVTVVEKDILDLLPGEVTHDGKQQTWFIGCPRCKEPGALAGHTVKWQDGLFTVAPSLLCKCGAHYFVVANQIRWV